MSEQDGKAIIQEYRDRFAPRTPKQQPRVILTVSVICAKTNEQAEELALSSLIWSLQKEKGEGQKGVPSLQEAKEYDLDSKEQETLSKMKQKMILGSPKVVREKLEKIRTALS